jgi:hypothetical protein
MRYRRTKLPADLVPRFISTVTHSEDDSGRYDKLILCQEDAPCP